MNREYLKQQIKKGLENETTNKTMNVQQNKSKLTFSFLFTKFIKKYFI